MHGRSPAGAGNGIAKPLKGAPQFAARGCIYCVSNLSGSLAGAGGGSPTIRGPASMQQVAEWLEKLGLAQYAQRFAENDPRRARSRWALIRSAAVAMVASPSVEWMVHANPSQGVNGLTGAIRGTGSKWGRVANGPCKDAQLAPESSAATASRLTAGAIGFLILSQ
jgi:hypothetical protein